jgi:hypothetical protein
VSHTDFQRGFIKAEVVSFDDLIAAGSLPRSPGGRQGSHRRQGHVMRVVVVEFRFNV